MAQRTYSTGTVSIDTGSNLVVGKETIWSDINAREGDRIAIDGMEPVDIASVIDVRHLQLWGRWSGGAKADVPYTIIQTYPQRVAGVAAAQDVGDMLAHLKSMGPIFNVPPDVTEPDPSYGYDGQYATQEATGKRWKKEGGLWVYKGQANALFSRYDHSVYVDGRPGSGYLLTRTFAPGVTFRAGMNESRARAEIAPTADATLYITKNGQPFASILFSAGSKAGVFICLADASFASGDLLEVIAPNPRDATLSGLIILLIGYR